MPDIYVNNKIIQAMEGETILSALKRAGIHVPTLCHVEGLPPTGSCRLCVVELEETGHLIPSCSYPVREGIKIKTHSPKAINARRTLVELLLASHPDDCLYCEKNNYCELRRLAENLGVRHRNFQGSTKNNYAIDFSSPALIRDPNKCILCGKCVRVCEEIQGVCAIDFTKRGSSAIVSTAFDEAMNASSCVTCGQCVSVCPTGALIEHTQIKEVIDALNDPEKTVVVQHAPSISISLAEEFHLKPGTDVSGLLIAALRKMGFDVVFDTAFAADLTIWEESAELVEKIQAKKTLPLMTSCSPGWIKFAETFYPEFIPHLSTCKSPQQMLGAIIKTYWAGKKGLDPARIYHVAVMPCTAKKFEAHRQELAQEGRADIDAVLTTRELAKLIRMYGIDLTSLDPEINDLPFGAPSSAGKLFGGSGGVLEGVLRTTYYLMTGKEPAHYKIPGARGLEGMKEVVYKIDDFELRGVALSGLKNARKLLEELKQGREDIHFIEIMACPGGCINGGGQPLGVNRQNVMARLQALYNIDLMESVKASHKNRAVADLYREFLKTPNGKKSKELLHTGYQKRNVLK